MSQFRSLLGSSDDHQAATAKDITMLAPIAREKGRRRIAETTTAIANAAASQLP
ncbi:MAG: hypothetical protein ACI8TX_002916 [Hyphomicrobiaceae bacterium]